MPLPVPPMIALVLPGGKVNDRSCSTGCSLPGYPKVTFRNSTRPVTRAGVTGSGGSAIDGAVPRTCSTRSALATARGARITIITAIITDIRICRM